MSPFARILARAIAATPGAVGGAFAAEDGELVDATTSGDAHEWALVTAHYGVILANLEAWLATKYFGGARWFVVHNRELDVAVHTVDHGYYALMATTPSPSTREPAIDGAVDEPSESTGGGDPTGFAGGAGGSAPRGIDGAVGALADAAAELRREMQ